MSRYITEPDFRCVVTHYKELFYLSDETKLSALNGSGAGLLYHGPFVYKKISLHRHSLSSSISRPMYVVARSDTSSLTVIAAALKNVYDRRHEITRGVKIVWETELMRHFTVKLERL